MTLVDHEALRKAGIPDTALAMLQTTADRHPHRLIFASISGAHLYGFPSPDSDFDLRGCHVLPFQRYCEVGSSKDTIETLGDRDGFELDLVTHDVRKFLLLLHKPNGYVLEQLLSPLVLRSSTWHEELVALAPRLVTRNHAQHYLGFAKTPRKLFHKTEPRRIKPLLYLYRVLLTGIHLMRTGRIQPNLEALLAEHPQPSVADLIQEKRSGKEHGVLASPGISMHARALDTLEAQLLEAGASSRLPDAPECLAELEDLHFRVRTEACHDPEPPR